MKIPTIPLNKPIYFAPTTPVDDLKITGNGSPCFCEGFPIKVEKKKAKKEASIPPNKTT